MSRNDPLWKFSYNRLLGTENKCRKSMFIKMATGLEPNNFLILYLFCSKQTRTLSWFG